LKYVPSFFAMGALTVATCVMPAALVAGNAGRADHLRAAAQNALSCVASAK